MASGTIAKTFTPADLPGQFVRVNKTRTVTVAANSSSGNTTIDVSNDGYTALGIGGFWVTGTASGNNSIVNVCYLSNSTTVTFNIVNISGTSRDWTIHVQILYVAN